MEKERMRDAECETRSPAKNQLHSPTDEIRSHSILLCPRPSLGISWIAGKVMGLQNGKATIEEQCDFLNAKKAITEGGYHLFTRLNEAVRTLSVIQGAPLAKMEFVQEDGDIALTVQASDTSEVRTFTKADSFKLAAKLKDLVRAAMLKTFLEQKKVKSRVAQAIEHHPQSKRFVRDGKNCSIAAQKFVHRARLNLLACNGNNYGADMPKGCRRCPAEIETQPHILQNYSMASGITQRHDRVLQRILDEIAKGSKSTYKILVDMET